MERNSPSTAQFSPTYHEHLESNLDSTRQAMFVRVDIRMHARCNAISAVRRLQTGMTAPQRGWRTGRGRDASTIGNIVHWSTSGGGMVGFATPLWLPGLHCSRRATSDLPCARRKCQFSPQPACPAFLWGDWSNTDCAEATEGRWSVAIMWLRCRDCRPSRMFRYRFRLGKEG
ncbi:hypothetical protein BU16DRAFT_333382 [Lophium mytilinum]|uniref:Uncharacterized protein n=1 Tax=Lophium mytilinum TaxID=390894 RepID=A0A6A6R038_9PEZI|nr:hypothetical protein BU16DRAFT_333382 [Lophium mytilinum]